MGARPLALGARSQMGRPGASQLDLFVFTQEAETQNTEGSDPKSPSCPGQSGHCPTLQPWSAVSLLRCGPQMGHGRGHWAQQRGDSPPKAQLTCCEGACNLSTGLTLPRKLPNIWKPSFLHTVGPAFFLALLRVGSQPKDTFMSLQVSGGLPGCVPSQASVPGDRHPTAIRGAAPSRC